MTLLLHRKVIWGTHTSPQWFFKRHCPQWKTGCLIMFLCSTYQQTKIQLNMLQSPCAYRAKKLYKRKCHEAYIFCRRESLRITIFSLWVWERSRIPFTGKLPTFEVRAAQCLRNNYVYCIHVQSQDTFQANGGSNPPRIHDNWQVKSLLQLWESFKVTDDFPSLSSATAVSKNIWEDLLYVLQCLSESASPTSTLLQKSLIEFDPNNLL